MYSAEKKFHTMRFDILLLAEDMLKVEDFTTLPRMIIPIKLDDLKKFFREQAKKLGMSAVEP